VALRMKDIENCRQPRRSRPGKGRTGTW